MKPLLEEISNCMICKEDLPLEPRPVVVAHPKSKIVIIGQAPGTAVHHSGIPWDDPSGKNLRNWMGITNSDFYNPEITALIPMGFCYPGKGKSGDLPPRKECASQWHDALLQSLNEVQLIMLVGKYAQDYYLGTQSTTLTQTVRDYQKYLPQYFVLPHPSPRNNIWKAKNPWFLTSVLPELKNTIAAITTCI